MLPLLPYKGLLPHRLRHVIHMNVTALKYIEMMATLKVHISRVQGRGGAPKRNKWANLSGHDGVGVILRLLSALVGRGRGRDVFHSMMAILRLWCTLK